MSVGDEIGKLEIFDHFEGAARASLAACAQQVSLPAGTTIVRQGQDSRDLFALVSGSLQAQRLTARGQYVLSAIPAGCLVGEVGFLCGGARISDLESGAASSLLAFDPDSLDAASAADPAFEQALYWTLWMGLSSKLRRANRRLLDFFEEPHDEPQDDAELLALPPEALRLDMATKRGVFEEQRLSSMEIHFLASLSREERFDAGQTIFREGDPGETMYVVADGSVVISTEVPGAGDEALAILERGDYFGEMALIDGMARSADARAHPEGGAVVLAIPRDVVAGILDIRKVSSIRLLKLLCRLVADRLRAIDEKLVGWYLMSGSADQQPAGVSPPS